MKKIYKVILALIIAITMFLLPLSIPKTEVFTPNYTEAKSIVEVSKQNELLLPNTFYDMSTNLYNKKLVIPLSNDYIVSLPANSSNISDIIEEISEPNVVEESKESHEDIIKRLVHDVDTGKAGNGQDRRDYLGEYYDEVQKIIDEKYKSIPKQVKKSTSSSNTSQSNVSQSVSELQSYAHNLLVEKGFSEEDFDCLVKLWNRESGWNPNSHNKSSGAHGIPQALPASKMSSHGSDYYTNGYTQIRWGIDYIINRYGSPTNAWKHFQNKNWY